MSSFARRVQRTAIPTASVVPSEWPDATNTGWQPTGATLQTLTDTSSGPGWHCDFVAEPKLYVTSDNAVLDGLDIDGRYLMVQANNVTIKRCRIRHSGYYCMFIGDLPTTYSGLTVVDCELDGLNDSVSPVIAINESLNATFLRCNIHGMGSSGPRMTTGNLMQDCWLHDFVHAAGNHEAGTSVFGNAGNITFRHNNISINTDGASSCIALYRDAGVDLPVYDTLIENNLFNGGNYGVMCGIAASDGSYPPTHDIRVVNNVFGREFNAECGRLGPIAQFSATNGTGNIASGNTWGGGAAATGTHAVGDPVVV